MKNLILIRHGKSSWKDIGINDHDRSLNKRGERDVSFMAQILGKKNINPGLLISSTALRAMATAKGFAKELGYQDEKIIRKKQLYLAELEVWMEAIQELPDSINSVMAFGHNPGITNLVNLITKKNIENLPTCGMCSINFKTDKWMEITPGMGLIDFLNTQKYILKIATIEVCLKKGKELSKLIYDYLLLLLALILYLLIFFSV